MPNVVLFALTAEKKTDNPMKISRLIYSQNIFGLLILHNQTKMEGGRDRAALTKD